MNHIVLFSFCLLFSIACSKINAQNLVWAKSYPLEVINEIQIDPAGNKFLISSEPFMRHIYKVDKDTNVIWHKSLYGILYTYFTFDYEGNMYIAGTVSPSSAGGAASIDFNLDAGYDTVIVGTGFGYIVKYDSSGILKWVKKFDKNVEIRNISLDINKNIVISGIYPTTATVDFDPDFNVVSITSGSGQFCAKYDSTCKILWAKEANFMSSAKCNFWGEIYSGFGTFQDSIEIQPGPGKYMLYAAAKNNNCLIRYTPQGDVAWGKVYGSNGPFMGIAGFDLDAYGNVYVAGHFTDSIDIEPGPGITMLKGPIGAVFRVGYLLKLDSSGNFKWGKKIIELGPGTLFACKTNMITGEVYVGGTFVGTKDFDPGPAVHNIKEDYWPNGYNFFLSKYNKDGNFQWVINTPGGTFGTWTDFGNSIICAGSANDSIDLDPTVSGRYVLGTGISAATHGYMVKYSTPLSVEYMQASTIALKVFPNPVSANEITIDLGQKYNQINIALLDITGKTISSGKRTGTAKFTYDTGNLMSGMYLLRVQTSEGHATVKLIKN